MPSEIVPPRHPLFKAASLAVASLREAQSMRRAARAMPKPVPWDWARGRVMPLLAGPYLDSQDAPLVRTVSALGCALTFGLPMGIGWALVDEPVARRWECTPEQVETAAMANLRRRAATLDRRVVRSGTLSGHIVHRISGEPTWAASLVLVQDELVRLFGGQDQVFAVPGRGSILSFGPEIPMHTAAEITIDFELSEVYPLMLDPFALEDGELVWCQPDDDD